MCERESLNWCRRTCTDDDGELPDRKGHRRPNDGVREREREDLFSRENRMVEGDERVDQELVNLGNKACFLFSLSLFRQIVAGPGQ